MRLPWWSKGLRLGTPEARGSGSIPGQETKIPEAPGTVKTKQNKKTKAYSYSPLGSSWLPHTPVLQPTDRTQYTGRSRGGPLRAPTPRPASQRRGHDLPPLPLGAAAKGGKGGGCENGRLGKNPKAGRRAVTGNLPAARRCSESRLGGWLQTRPRPGAPAGPSLSAPPPPAAQAPSPPLLDQ